jgi:hypothetical protein
MGKNREEMGKEALDFCNRKVITAYFKNLRT